MKKSNSHFTDLMITKDTSGNADFIFGVDMNRLMIDNSAYSALIADMTDVAKKQIAANSEVLSFNITRRQVKSNLSLNALGSPSKPEVFTNETISKPIISSIREMKEVPLSIGGSNGIKYLTASDTDLSKQTAGTYQYELSISTIDGFIPTIDKLLKKLYRTSDDISNYLALLDIPENYNSKRRRTKISIKKESTDRMSKTYVDALSYFQNLKNISTEYKRASSLIASRSASRESIGTFQKRLNSVISKVEGMVSKTGTGVSPSSVTNKAANSGMSSVAITEIKHSFNDTISVEYKDARYTDYFKGKGRVGGGLNTYSSTEIKNSKPKTIYLEAPMTSLARLETRGITLNTSPSSEDNTCEIENKQTMSTEKYIGSSTTATGGLLKDSLSPIDLSTVSIGNLISADDINLAVSPIAPKLSSVPTIQTPADNITKVMPKEITTEGKLDLDSEINISMPQTMVLVATQDSDVEMCSTGGATTMLKSLQWVSIDDAVGTKGSLALTKQDGGDSEVVNAFYIMEWK